MPLKPVSELYDVYTARVIQSTGSWYDIQKNDGDIYAARLPGRFRQTHSDQTNPIAVGDYVNFTINEDNSAKITNILERSNYVTRKATHGKRGQQILVSNVDYAILVNSIKQPKYKTGFIDRFLVSCEAYQVTPILFFNKMDLANGSDLNELNHIMTLYQDLGYKVLRGSIMSSKSVNELKVLIKDKTSVFIGPSGVGKTSLMNAIDVRLEEKTTEISSYSNKGKHTTTFAKLVPLPFGGYLADTPGIREFGLYNIEDWEISLYFPEMLLPRKSCKFNTCTHIHEPSCGVLEAVDQGEIAPSRYLSYLNMIESS
ncbi:MAG: ribosome small subunit-dependent GTPase A [Balneola sp.]|nr:ribosome small subunit-dependent GTPase A [Balneola sp.]